MSSNTLTQSQQALADQFFNNRGQWEVYDDSSESLYCVHISIYKMTDGAELDCYYSDVVTIPTEAGAGFVFLAGRAYYVTKDNFQIGNNLDPANWGRLIPGQPAAYRGTGYSPADNDGEKRANIEYLFSGYS